MMPLKEEYHNKDGEYSAMYVHPRPFQQPHPPVWLMSNAPHTYKMAAEKGFNVIGMSSPPNKFTELLGRLLQRRLSEWQSS